MDEMLTVVKEAGAKRIAIVGIAKHAGKTTVLNDLLAQAEQEGVKVSIQSIGVDGERMDAIMGVPKPEVVVPAGALVASSAQMLTEGTAELVLEEATGIDSPLGEVYIARVKRSGTVILAGIRQMQHVKDVLARFDAKGVDLHLVDGAFDRMIAASPDVTDGVILVTGAVAGRSVDQVARQTAEWLWRFRLPRANEEWECRLLDLAEQYGRPVAGGPSCTPAVLAQTSSLTGHLCLDANWPQDAQALCIPGAVTDRVLAQMEGMPRGFSLLVPDATHVFVTAKAWRSYVRRGHRLLIGKETRVLAIAVNPHSIAGYDLPREALVERIREVAGELPVMDVKAGIGGDARARLSSSG
jgi:hypothetical protein